MPAHTPEEVHQLFAEGFQAGDLEGLIALYEPEAILVPQPGQVVTGISAIRDALSAFLAMKGAFHLEMGSVFRAGDIALLSSRWTLTPQGASGEIAGMGGTTVDVVRRQSDGTWLVVIDNPYGAS